jgi:CcmD family protein
VTTAEKYVLAAFLVVFAVVLAYVVLYAFKLSRLERELSDLAERARRGHAVTGEREREPVAR